MKVLRSRAHFMEAANGFAVTVNNHDLMDHILRTLGEVVTKAYRSNNHDNKWLLATKLVNYCKHHLLIRGRVANIVPVDADVLSELLFDILTMDYDKLSKEDITKYNDHCIETIEELIDTADDKFEIGPTTGREVINVLESPHVTLIEGLGDIRLYEYYKVDPFSDK